MILILTMSNLVAHCEPPMVIISISQVVLIHLGHARHDDPVLDLVLIDADPARGAEVGVTNHHDTGDPIALVIDVDAIYGQVQSIALLPIR